MPTAQEIYASTIRGLPPDERLQLAVLILNELAKTGVLNNGNSKPQVSLRGIWKGLNITDEDIDEVRQEMWSKFPREDV